MAYLSLCTYYQKLSDPRKGSVSKPILHSTFTSNQVYLIDIYNLKILTDFDSIKINKTAPHKICVTLSFNKETCEKITQHLLDIFTTFGAP